MSPTAVPLLQAVAGRTLPTVTSFATRDPVVGLTFDDGPNPECTPELLRILEQHGALATFFVVGQAAAAHPDLIDEIAAAGHAIGNHTWSHPSLPGLARKERISQIRQCEEVLGPGPARIFRPPYGHQTARTWLTVRAVRYTVVAWSVAAFDWEDVSAEFITERLVSRTQPGSIVLLHDGLETSRAGADTTHRTAMLRGVDAALGVLGEQYRFLTVPQLLAGYRPVPHYWRMR